jgi:uncharacterized protein with GYD domain
MSLYMTQFSYTPEAWAALARNPEDRSAAVGALAEALGGRMIAFYYSFGEYDGVIIGEYPDNNTAAVAALAGVSAGHLKAIKTVPLLSVEEATDVMRRAGEMMFRGPAETPGGAALGMEIPPERVVGPEAAWEEVPPSPSESQPPREPPPEAEKEPPPPGPPPDANAPA